jgi:hypothetical protein
MYTNFNIFVFFGNEKIREEDEALAKAECFIYFTLKELNPQGQC